MSPFAASRDQDGVHTLWLDVAAATWHRAAWNGSPAPLPDAALYLEGSRLYAFGGRDARGTPGSHGVIYDLDDQKGVAWSPAFPPRAAARLTRSNEGRALLLFGGADALGRHDDIWSVMRAPGGQARRVASDTPLAPTFDARAAFLSAGFDGGGARFLRAVDGQILEGRRRAPEGWIPSSSPPIGEACQPADPEAGERCGLPSAPFWAAGRRDCADRGAACVGASVPAELQTTLPGSAQDIAVDGVDVWTVTTDSLRRFRAARDAAPAPAGVLLLPSDVHRVAAAGGVALVTSRDGVRAIRGDSSLQAVAPLRVCGRPLAVAPLGDLRFGVTTTLGFNVVSLASGSAVLESIHLLHGEADLGGKHEAIPVNAAKLAWCHLVDQALPSSLVETLRHRTVVVARDAGHVVAGVAPWYFAINAQRVGAPTVKGVQLLAGRSPEARWDGDRVYVVNDQGNHVLRWGDGLDALSLAGAHDVPAWVRARGVAPVVARRLSNGSVEVAWISP